MMMLGQKHGLINGTRMIRRWTSVVLTLCLLFSATSHAFAAENIWKMAERAKTASVQGDYATAVPIWEELVRHFADAGDWESAAIFAGYLDEYFDGVKDYENAIRYYELENEYWLKFGKDWGAVDLQRAEQIRTTIEAYISATDDAANKQSAAAKQGGLAKFEPAYGMYIGLYSERDSNMRNVFTRSPSIYGKNHAIYLAYTQWGKTFPKLHAQRAKEAGSALQIAWEPIGGLDQVVDGPYLRKWAQDAKAAGIPIFLRYASEMNGDWTVWHGDPQKYIEKFRMIYQVMQEEAPNVAMVWSPNDVPKFSMDAYYPGDKYVDWVGISLYSEPYENGDPAKPMFATSPVERLDELYRLYADRKPLMISETAVSHYAHRAGEDVTDWALLNLDRLYEVMPKKYPRLKAITYFNVDLQDKESQNNYLLGDNPRMLEAYKHIISAPYYLGKVETGAKPADNTAYLRMEGQTVFFKQARIVPFVKIPDMFIGRVEYALNGQTITAQTSAPFSLQLDAGSVPEGSVLEIRVFNKSGQRVAAKSFSLSSAISVNINKSDFHFAQPPVIIAGNTLAPLRAIFEAMGATVSWDAATQTATGVKGKTTVKLQIGNQTVWRNDEPIPLEQPAQLVNGSTMAPARFVGEAFGGEVSWDGTTRTVVISAE